MNAPQLFKGFGTFAGEEISWSLVSTGRAGLTAESLNRSIESFIHTWAPRKRKTRMDLAAYVDVAYARQCFHLTVAAQDSSVSDMHRFACELERTLGALEKAHPQFTYPHSLSISAAHFTGELLPEDALEALEELDAVLPKPLTAPTDAGTYIVVDDYQTTENFQATMLPDRGAFKVYAVDDLDPAEFEQGRRVIFGDELFPPTFTPFLAVDRYSNAGGLTCTISLPDTGEITPWLLLRDLHHFIDAHLTTSADTREVSAVEYYTQLAFAASCTDLLVHHPRALTELTYRRRLLVELCASFATVKKRNPYLATAHALSSQALRACERMELDASIDFVAPIEQWTQENLRLRLPHTWDPRMHREMVDEMIYTLLHNSVGTGLVRVMDYNTSEEVGRTGLPDRLRYDVEKIDAPFKAEDFTPPNCYIFTQLEEDEDADGFYA